jgi:hypothetical protein
VNGLGNVIIGYNEPRGGGDNRSGSHNLVVGSRNNYASYGGFVGGLQGGVTTPYSTAINGGGIALRSTAGFSLDASTNIALTAGASVLLRGGDSIDVRASSNLTLNGGSATSVTAGGSLTLNGSTVTNLTAGALVKINAPIVSIN